MPCSPEVGDVPGEVGLAEVLHQFDAEEARTIGGFVAEELGRVPAQGDVIEREAFKVTVELVQEKRVRQVRLEKK